MEGNASTEPDTLADDLPNAISKSLESYFSPQEKRHSVAIALLVYWEEDDIGVAKEIKEVEALFRQELGYETSIYEIPSEDSTRRLLDRLTKLVNTFGQNPDSLVVLYYGGHGEKPGGDMKKRGECIWAAKGEVPKDGGSDPTLDWFEVQPQLLCAKCDIVVLLDCCYAGQSVRARPSHRIEYLCAANMAQIGASGTTPKWPSFTRALISEIRAAIARGEEITLPALHARLTKAEVGLMAQPFYTAWSTKSNIRRPPISLSRLPGPASLQRGESAMDFLGPKHQDIYMKISLLDVVDADAMASLTHWLTKDSPRSLANIQLMEILSNAQDTSDTGGKLLAQSKGGSLLSSLGDQGRAEAPRLLKSLRSALADFNASMLSGKETGPSALRVKDCCDQMAAFMEDSIGNLGPEALVSFDSSSVADSLRSRVNTRLRRLIIAKDEDLPDMKIRVSYDANSDPESRFRRGRRSTSAVLVEYINYDAARQAWALTQAKRMAALHAEPKSPEFRCLSSLGFFSEKTPRVRFGLVYELPALLAGRPFRQLSQIITEMKFAPLGSRVLLCSSLCNALVKLHSIGWYHKNIKTDNVLIFGALKEGNPQPVWDLENPYLVGFDQSRPFEAETNQTVDFGMDNNLYRHPERWGRPVRFRSYHDLYALGILLIEVGTWKLIPSPNAAKSPFRNLKDPEQVRSHLLDFTREKVAHAAGTHFVNATTTCLAKRNWGDYEEWQAQGIVRREVLAPLQEVAKGLGKDLPVVADTAAGTVLP